MRRPSCLFNETLKVGTKIKGKRIEWILLVDYSSYGDFN